MTDQKNIPDSVIQKVLAAVDHEALIALTRDLVRINSVWDPAAGTSEQKACACAAAWAEKRGFDVQIEIVAPQRPNAIVTWQAGPGKACLLFEGHTDVVTPGDLSAWDDDPFGAVVRGGRMYGRGTNDTKGNLAAMLTAMAALKTAGVPLRGTIVGAVLCDEEDRMRGVLDFIKKGHADAVTGAVICEPQDGMLCTKQKGAIRARYTIAGRMSHGAMPLAGLNTAPALAALIQGLGRLESTAVDTIGRDSLLGWPSFTPTVIQAPAAGPPQLNVMPGRSQLLLDVRTVPGQSHDALRDDLRRLAASVQQQVVDDYREYDRRLALARDHGLRVEVAFLTDRPCTETDVHDPVVRAAHWATQRRGERQPVYAGVPGATDGTFLWSKKNIPIVTMGAGDREVPHQVNEWVDLNQLCETADIYALTALHYLY